MSKNKQYTKSGNQGVKLEDMEIGQTYAITINPASQPENKHSVLPWRNLCMWLCHYKDWLIQFQDGVELVLYLEVSPTGRYHFHGKLVLLDYNDYINFLEIMNKQHHYEIDTIKDMDVWDLYIKKQRKIFEYLYTTKVPYLPLIINENSQVHSKFKIKEPPVRLSIYDQIEIMNNEVGIKQIEYIKDDMFKLIE
jgi:hypothetical protein